MTSFHTTLCLSHCDPISGIFLLIPEHTKVILFQGYFPCCSLFAFASPLSPDIHIAGTFSFKSLFNCKFFRKSSHDNSIQNRAYSYTQLYIFSIHLTLFFSWHFVIWIFITLFVYLFSGYFSY